MVGQVEMFSRTLWSAITPAHSPVPPLHGALRADVTVVGGGLLGLSIALGLARRGASVILLEGQNIAFGASGRNTGFVVPGLKGSLSVDAVRALVGPEKGDALLTLIGQGGNYVFDLIRTLGIECSAEQRGCLQPVPMSGDMAQIEKMVKWNQAAGIESEILDERQITHVSGIKGYRGALLLPTGGQINPLAYALGLNDAIVRHGGRVYLGHARRLKRYGRTWCVEVSGGASVQSDQVIVATNALTGDLLPKVARSIIPVWAYLVATQRMDAGIRERILPGHQTFVDLRLHPFAVRWSPDGRLITGGAAKIHDPGAVDRMARAFLRRLARFIPDLPPLQAGYAWNGRIAVTNDFMPRLWNVDTGLYAPIGCNGRGVALTSVFGKAISDYLVSRDEKDLPLPITQPKPYPLHGVVRHAPSAWLAQAQLRDWIGG